MSDASLEEAVSTTKQIESTPQGILKRWTAELDTASRAEDEWRKAAEAAWEVYKSGKQTQNRFNILWSNTETLRPALYNSLPNPDVRRRFRDKDTVGRVASTVLERSLKYEIDTYDFDHEAQDFVLDVVVCGRGVARVKYDPKTRPQAGHIPDPLSDDKPPEEIYDECAPTEHVIWDDFRRGPGKTWKQVPWVAFRHRLPYDQLVEKFGEELAKKIPLADTEKTDKTQDKSVRSILKTAEIWEIWDKVGMRVLFICEGYKAGPLGEPIDDPLKLDGFFPCPRPVYFIEDSTSLIPQVPYDKYKTQAEELNKVSYRITKIVDALKVRGAYASNLAELATIIEAGDNQMIPIVNASEVASMGGLDKAIWIMPIDKLAQVLEDLYVAREKTLQTIYEITGLGDIMRGVSNPHETLGAQQLKSQWGTLRLQRLQREVQRLVRDLMRVTAEIISEHFQVETLQAMTGIELPTKQDKMKLQAVAAQAQQTGQQVPPEVQAEGEKMLAQPTWDDVMALLKSDDMRRFHIGIETDSTIQETLTRDAQAMQEAITAVVSLFGETGQAVQSGVLDLEVVKTMALAMARNAKMGAAVEEALDMMKQPPPPQPEPPPPDHSVDVAKIKAQSDAQISQITEKNAADKHMSEQAHEQQLTQMKAQSEAVSAQAESQVKAAEAASKARIAEVQAASASEIAAAKNASAERIAAADRRAAAAQAMATAQVAADSKRENELLKAAVQIITAQMAATKSADESAGKIADAEYAKQEGDMGAVTEALKQMMEAHSAPKRFDFEMDDDGNVVGATQKMEK